jgi:HD-GYP domain-containing protein (c-di-GMP phosphodiesterase class II)
MHDAATITPASLQAPVTVAPDSFESRCLRLRLLVWTFDARANLKRPPSALPRFLGAPEFTQLLAGFARLALAAEQPSPAQIAPGCWAVPIVHRRKMFPVGISLAVGFEPGFLVTALFDELCAHDAISPELARNMLAPLVRPMQPALADLAQTLDWMAADLAQASTNAPMIDQFTHKLAQAYEEVNFLFRLARFLNLIDNPVQLVDSLLRQIQQILPFQWVAVRFHPDHALHPVLKTKTLVAGNPADLPIEACANEMLASWSTDQWTRLLVPGTHPLATAAGAELLADPITHDGKVIGVLIAGNKTGSDTDLSSVETQLVDAIADFIGVFHENSARFAEQQSLFLGTLRALTAAIDAKDHYTRGHSDRVGLLAQKMARALNLPAKTIEEYRVAGLVHDVGKIGVPETVLCKAAKLTDEEFALIKQHPEIGHAILKDIPPLADILPGVLYHHERWDGKGYPHRIAGENVPFIARVLALADTFDAMSSNRAYRSARPREATLAEIRKCAGTQFDPALTETFCQLDFTDFDEQLALVK